jgi:hypothetical protein
MRRLLPVLLILVWMSLPMAASAQEGDSTPTPGPGATGQAELSTPQPGSPAIGIAYPAPGDSLEGLVEISGLITLPGFNLWQLSFAYADNPTDTWFLLASGGSEPLSGPLHYWDTTALTDGDYSLRLRVFFADAYRDVLVTPVQIRNYSQDTPTPSPTAAETDLPASSATPTPPTATSTATRTPRLTPTPLPTNPVILENEEIYAALLQGTGYTGVAFLLFGILLYIGHKLSNRRK